MTLVQIVNHTAFFHRIIVQGSTYLSMHLEEAAGKTWRSVIVDFIHDQLTASRAACPVAYFQAQMRRLEHVGN